MKTGLKTLLLLLTALLLLNGCRSLLQKDSEESLQATLKRYEATIRWGYPGQIYKFLRKDIAEETKLPENLDAFRVSGYMVISPPVLVDEKTATQTAVIGYVEEARQVERSLTDTQYWEHDPETNSWSRINPIPEFK